MVALLECPVNVRDELKILLTYVRVETEVIRGIISPQSVTVNMWSQRPDGSLLFYAGYMPKVCGHLQTRGIAWDSYERIDNKKVIKYDLSRIDIPALRPEQRQMLKALVEWDTAVIVSPTGSGKSFVCGIVCKLFPQANIIFSAPTIDTVATLQRYLSNECGERVGQVGGGKNNAQRITVATYDSVTRVGNADRCDILVVDECHRAASPSYARDFAAIQAPIKRLGLTATPVGRSDQAEWMVEGILGPVVLNVLYNESVANGSVVPLEIVVHENPHGPTPEVITNMASQVDKDRTALWLNRRRNEIIAEDMAAMYELLGQPQTLVLVEKVEHLFALHQLLPDYEIAYGDVDAKKLKKIGDRQDIVLDPVILKGLRGREEVRQRFEQGIAKKVLATSIFATGVSSNHCGLVGFASGAGAPIGFLQSIGRGSRVNVSAEKRYSVCLMWRDLFHRAYTNRADKLARAAGAAGHRVTRIPAGQSVETWTPKN